MWEAGRYKRSRDRLDRSVGTLSIMPVVGALAILAYLLRGVLVPFVVAAAIAYIAAPLINRLGAHLPVHRGIIACFVFLVIVGSAAGVAFLIVSATVHDVGRLSQQLTENLALVSARLSGVTVDVLGQQIGIGQIIAGFGEDLRRWLDDPARATEVMRWGAEVFFGGVLTIVLLFYFMLSGPRLARGALWLVPPRYRRICVTFVRRFDPVLRRYVLGVCAVALYATIVAWVFIGPVFGLPDSVLLAVVTGLLEPIPFFGPLLAPIIVGATALDYGDAATIVGFVVYALALRLSIDQIVGPLVLGTAVGLPPSVIILAFIAGWVLFGFVGIFLAVPAAAALRTALVVLYTNGSSEHGRLDRETES